MESYDSLKSEFEQAVNQTAKGKGRSRHANGENFEDQKICVITRWLRFSPVAGALFQAAKKIFESSRLEPEAAIFELHGAMNYLGAACIELRRFAKEQSHVKTKNDQVLSRDAALAGTAEDICSDAA